MNTRFMLKSFLHRTPLLCQIIFLASIISLSSCQEASQKETTTADTTTTKAPVVKTDSTIKAGPVALVDSLAKDSTTANATKTDSVVIKTKGGVPEWPTWPTPLPGSLLPNHRIIAFYGNPYSTRMGILGKIPPDQMLAQLDEEVAKWQRADSTTKAIPALHLIIVTAQPLPGKDKKYRLRMPDKLIYKVLDWAKQRKDAIVFLDVQVGHSTVQEELAHLLPFLELPNVHLGIDAEFSMKEGNVPGQKVGTFDAADINYASSLLADAVTRCNLPPKVFTVHRFTRKMITNAKDIKLDPRVQIVMHMDGFGSAMLKKDTYRRYIIAEPVQYTGFKLFYVNDNEQGGIMTPEQVLQLNPKPLYIQYQ